MGLTRLGRFTLTLAVLALLGYWVYTHPEILERLRTPRVPAPTPQAAPFPAPAPPGPQVTTAPPPQVPGGLSARERGRVHSQTIAAAPEVLAVVGHCNSRATLAAGPLYESEGIPVITATSTNPDIAQLGDFIFRVVGNDNDQARALANALWSENRRTVVVFVDQEDAYSRGLSDNFQRRFARLGGRVITNAFTIAGDITVSTDLREADAILVPGEYADAGKIARLVRDLGISAPIVGGDAVYSQGLFAFGGEAARGVRATAFYHYTVRDSPLLPRAAEFARRVGAVIHAPPNHQMGPGEE